MNDFRDMSDARLSGTLEGIRPYLEEFVRRKISIVEMRVFLLSDRAELTSEAALAAWMEVKALRRLLNAADKDVKFGQAIAARLPPVAFSSTLPPA